MIKLSDLRHRLILEEPLLTGDGAGGSTISWMPRKTLWAKIKPKSGQETFNRDQQETIITHEITTRFDEEIEANMRLAKGGRIFQILAVLNQDEKNEWLTLLTREEGL